MKEQRKKSDKTLSLIEQATAIIQAVGIPIENKTKRGAEKMAMVFLAVAGVTDSFDQAKGLKEQRFLKTRDIINFINKHYEEEISPGSYDDIRRKDLKLLVLADLILNSPANPNAATNDPTRAYTLSPDFAALVRTYGKKQWLENLARFLQGKTSLREILARERNYQKVPMQLPDGIVLQFSSGKHNTLQKAIVEEFLPRFGAGCRVLYIGDTANKLAHIEREELEKLNFFELAHDELPDIIAYHPQKNWLFLIEAVHSSGSISEIRMLELKRLTKNCKAEIIYVTAFLAKKDFRQWAAEIAWETEVWIAENPDHMIHFNGNKFLGAYKTEESKKT